MIVSWNWFWYLLFGFALGGASVYLWMMLREKAITFRWFEWLLFAFIFLTVILMGQTFIASLNEGEIRAAWLSQAFLGIPAIAAAVGLFRLVSPRAA